MKDLYGNIIEVGDNIVDENGNVGKTTHVYDDRAIVDFGPEIRLDAVQSEGRIRKGTEW